MARWEPSEKKRPNFSNTIHSWPNDTRAREEMGVMSQPVLGRTITFVLGRS